MITMVRLFQLPEPCFRLDAVKVKSFAAMAWHSRHSTKGPIDSRADPLCPAIWVEQDTAVFNGVKDANPKR